MRAGLSARPSARNRKVRSGVALCSTNVTMPKAEPKKDAPLTVVTRTSRLKWRLRVVPSIQSVMRTSALKSALASLRIVKLMSSSHRGGGGGGGGESKGGGDGSGGGGGGS